MRTAVSTLVAPLIVKLGRYVRLSANDKSALEKLKLAPVGEAKARADIVREGQNSSVVRLVVAGWACRYKDLPDGRRQIIGFLIPGDFCDLKAHILQQMDHSIGAITATAYLEISREQMEELTGSRPRVAQALLWQHLTEASVQREWLLNVGQRTSLERLAHLLVELYIRMRAAGFARDHTIEFPLTQNDLAEANGVSPVHVNRTLQELRRQGLIEVRAKRLKILDQDRLRKLAMFKENYLHLDREGRQLDAQH